MAIARKGFYMFIGEYQHNIDDKGRLAVPSKFRDSLVSGGVITRGLDGCLFLYTLTEWDVLAKKLQSLPLTQKEARSFVRLMFAGAAEVSMDKQGRINVPNFLLEFGDLKKEVMITGLYNRVEIWQKDRWEKYKNSAEASHDNLAEQLGALGI